MTDCRDFRELFGRAPTVGADAPGRVNLIGEHTDYNGGFVLPAAIPQRTRVELAPRDDMTVRVASAQYPGTRPIQYELGAELPDRGWVDYVKGMTQVLRRSYALRGFDARIASDVPLGGGLSSSAALEIALGRALRDAYGLPIDDIALAIAARRAENEFVGAPVGIMDQMACSLADTRTALFLDTRSLEYSYVLLPEAAALIVIDSGVKHQHAGGEYGTRRAECAAAADQLGVRELRDVQQSDLSRVDALPPPLNRRARHVVTENARVLDAVETLRIGNLRGTGELFSTSHTSMRDDFEVSVPAIDALVHAATRVRGTYGARLTGGGFGGAVVVLADAAGARETAAQILHLYRSLTAKDGRVLVPA